MSTIDHAKAIAESARRLKGLEMAEGIGRRNDLDATIRRINKLTYKVKSQSKEGTWYLVVKQYGSNKGERQTGDWTCECPDFTHSKMKCKHIHAVIFSKQLRKKVFEDTLLQMPISQAFLDNTRKLGHVVCPRCGKDDYQKFGLRNNKKNEPLQRYKCHNCNRIFTFNPGFEYAKASAKVITIAIDLYFRGMSVRKIEDHIKQFYNASVSDSAVCHWLRKFVNIVQPYVDSIVPTQVGGVYHVDEMMLHVRKENNLPMRKEQVKVSYKHRRFDDHYSWLWNLMDSRTRFWICSRISQKRDIAAATQAFNEMKQRAPLPKAIVHDGLHTYDQAYQEQLFTLKNPRIENIRSVGAGEKGLNMKVERLNGTMRDREIVMRGLDTAKTAQEIADGMRIHYNFVRPNMAIRGLTPAEVAGINLNLGNNKVENLIRQAAIRQKELQKEPSVVKGLGIRINHVQIQVEKDYIEIKPRGWLDKKTWVEINDILRVQGFGWLSKGEESRWWKSIAETSLRESVDEYVVLP